jgi:type IV pilus assembly protein PilB
MSVTAQQILDGLVELGFLPRETADAIGKEALSTGLAPEELLRKKKLASEEQIARARAKVYNIPFVSLSSQAFSPDVVNMIPEAVSRKYTILPFQFDEKSGAISVAR